MTLADKNPGKAKDAKGEKACRPQMKKDEAQIVNPTKQEGVGKCPIVLTEKRVSSILAQTEKGYPKQTKKVVTQSQPAELEMDGDIEAENEEDKDTAGLMENDQPKIKERIPEEGYGGVSKNDKEVISHYELLGCRRNPEGQTDEKRG